MPSITPKKVDEITLVWGGKTDELLPPWEEIPDEFKNGRTKWNNIISTWFFSGLKGATFLPKPGIDQKTALRHIGSILGSFQPAHEHKEAGCAYLMSQWFDDVNLPKEPA